MRGDVVSRKNMTCCGVGAMTVGIWYEGGIAVRFARDAGQAFASRGQWGKLKGLGFVNLIVAW